MEHGPLIEQLRKERIKNQKIDMDKFIPLKDEIIKEIQEDGTEKYKVGDGKTVYNQLPYLVREDPKQDVKVSSYPKKVPTKESGGYDNRIFVIFNPVQNIDPKQIRKFFDCDTYKSFYARVINTEDGHVIYKMIDINDNNS